MPCQSALPLHTALHCVHLHYITWKRQNTITHTSIHTWLVCSWRRRISRANFQTFFLAKVASHVWFSKHIVGQTLNVGLFHYVTIYKVRYIRIMLKCQSDKIIWTASPNIFLFFSFLSLWRYYYINPLMENHTPSVFRCRFVVMCVHAVALWTI